jgi:hypothetical protein
LKRGFESRKLDWEEYLCCRLEGWCNIGVLMEFNSFLVLWFDSLVGGMLYTVASTYLSFSSIIARTCPLDCRSASSSFQPQWLDPRRQNRRAILLSVNSRIGRESSTRSSKTHVSEPRPIFYRNSSRDCVCTTSCPLSRFFSVSDGVQDHSQQRFSFIYWQDPGYP